MPDVNHCGTCTLCCKLLGIPELKKLPNEWCGHCDKGRGCRIYEDRPPSCSDFECMWLATQLDPNAQPMPMAMRPDKSKVVLAPTTIEDVISVHVDPGTPHAWKRDDIEQFLGRIVRHGLRVVIGWGNTTDKISLERHGSVVARRRIKMTEPDENGMQWYRPEDQ